MQYFRPTLLFIYCLMMAFPWTGHATFGITHRKDPLSHLREVNPRNYNPAPPRGNMVKDRVLYFEGLNNEMAEQKAFEPQIDRCASPANPAKSKGFKRFRDGIFRILAFVLLTWLGFLVRGLIGYLIILGCSRMAGLNSANRALYFIGIFQLAFLDATGEFFQSLEKLRFHPTDDGLFLGFSGCAAAQNQTFFQGLFFILCLANRIS